jgi:hypothetical protein
MQHFVRIVMEKQDNLQESLNDSIFPGSYIYETEQDATVFEMPLPKALTEKSADEFAEKLANYMFEQGYEDFDIEISADDLEESDEITLENDEDFYEEFGILGYVPDDPLWEAEYDGRDVKLNKPIRSSDGPKKFHVYVKNPKGNVVKVNFGDPDMEIKADDPDAKRSFRARHNCENPGPKTKARYWSCKAW